MQQQPTYSTFRMVTASASFLIPLLFILLVGSGSPFGISFADDSTTTIQSVSVLPVDYQDSYRLERDFIGAVEARQTSLLGFEINGMLKTMPLDEGQSVKKGEVLAEMDVDRLNARKNEAQANLARAKSDARLAASTFQRTLEASEADAVSVQDKDEAQDARDRAAAALNVAEAQLESILVDIEKSRLLAPFDGVITKRMVDEGTVVSAGQSVLELQELAGFEIRVGVTSQVVADLNPGDVREVSIADQRYRASISAILPVRGQSRTVDIILTLEGQQHRLFPGDVARIPFAVPTTRRGFWVPLTALREGQRGLWSLYAIAGQNDNNVPVVERRSVEILYTGNEHAYVFGAVDDGERIVIEGAAKLVPGQAVQIESQAVKIESVGQLQGVNNNV